MSGDKAGRFDQIDPGVSNGHGNGMGTCTTRRLVSSIALGANGGRNGLYFSSRAQGMQQTKEAFLPVATFSVSTKRWGGENSGGNASVGIMVFDRMAGSGGCEFPNRNVEEIRNKKVEEIPRLALCSPTVQVGVRLRM